MNEETRTVAPEDALSTQDAGRRKPQPLEEAEAAQVVGGHPDAVLMDTPPPPEPAQPPPSAGSVSSGCGE